jgi:hypothetical protein
VIRADSEARLTMASITNGKRFTARSTRPTQLAQVMPSMTRSTVAIGTA